MNWIKLTEKRAFLLTLWILVCFALFVNGVNSFISSSEFWSIYLSKTFFLFDSGWKSVYLKPIFHLILCFIYVLNLNDFYHIYATKILFATNGVLQFFLIYKILSKFYKFDFLNLFLTAFLFCSPLLLANYDRIRSDQVALTFFLLFIFISYSDFKFKYLLQFIAPFFFFLIAFKHIYFSILCFCFMPFSIYYSYYKSLTRPRRFIVILCILSVIVWSFKIAIPASKYFFISYETTGNNYQILLNLLKTEWIYIYICTFPFIFKDFRHYIKQKKLMPMLILQLLIVFFVLIHPQKFDFFIASFIPIFYFPGLIFIHFLNINRLIPITFVASLMICLSFYSIFLAHKDMHVFSFNNPQLVAIERISNIVTKNNLSYLDGVGILPRGKNIGCFVSPDDDIANNNCILAIEKKSSDVIIVTNRLMSLPFDFSTLENFDYVGIGPNFYVKKKLAKRFQIDLTTWRPPSLIFGSEQLY